MNILQIYNETKHLVGGLSLTSDSFLCMNLSISLIMTSDKLITTELNDLENAESILKENKIEKLPIVNSENQLVGLITFKDIIKNRMRPNACKDQ